MSAPDRRRTDGHVEASDTAMGLERHYNETYVARLAAREKQIQQNFRPVISVHKWFARRPGSLFRALALAEFAGRRVESAYTEPQALVGVCLDPFMGGGTPVFEAARLGLSVVGYDTNPMAAWVVERELEDVDPDELRAAGERVAADVQAAVGERYVTDFPGCGGEADVRYFFWARHHRCACGAEHPLLAHTQLVSTGMGRHPREVHICPACLTLAEFDTGARPERCPACAAGYDEHLVAPDSLHACACGATFRIPPRGEITETPSARLVGVEYDCGRCSKAPGASTHTYKSADRADQERYSAAARLAAAEPSRFWPDGLIPPGEETRRLLRWGYNRWQDLFNARQLHGLGVLAERIDSEPDGPVKRALQTCFSDMLRFQNMLCRYDRQALKPTDAFAVHGFPVPRVSCEPALLGATGVGSGGFRHMLAKYARAKSWCREPYETVLDGSRLRRVPVPGERLAPRLVRRPSELGVGRAALLRRGSLGPGRLDPESVEMVLTDPAYFDMVQYGQLMDFCYAWLRRLAPANNHFAVANAFTGQDAVGGAEVDLAEFTRRLSTVYTEAAVALKPGGAFVFTYHHNDPDAYAPLVVACLDAGLSPTRLYACPSEMRASKHIHRRNASTVDAVFVLRKPPVPDGLARDFSDPGRVLAGRVAALRRAGLEPTAADRACLRHGALAARAIGEMVALWDRELRTADRLALARRALGLPVAAPAAA
jgi:hypothetical protein